MLVERGNFQGVQRMELSGLTAGRIYLLERLIDETGGLRETHLRHSDQCKMEGRESLDRPSSSTPFPGLSGYVALVVGRCSQGEKGGK